MALRVCFVSPRSYGYFNPDVDFRPGGAQRQIHLLSTALAGRFDVHVVVGDYGQPRTEHREGVTLHRAYPLHDRRHPLQPVKHLLLLARAMRRADADVYVYRGGPRTAGVVRLLAHGLGSRWVLNIANDANIARRPARLPEPVGLLYTRALRVADGIIAQTTAQQAMLREAYGVTSTVVPNGYPSAPPPVDPADRAYALWVGTLDADQKRPHLLLDCAERVPDQQFRLVGPAEDSEYNRRLRDRAATLDNVTLVGEVPPDEIHDHYRHAFALVNTSAYEGFPNTFLEAWRQGTPVVTLDLDPRRYGWRAETDADGNVDRLAAIVGRLGCDHAHRARLSTAAREHFEANFELSAVATQYGDVIERVAQGRSADGM